MIRSEHTLILIPAYNEQGAVRQVVSQARQVMPRADLLVVDDGSTDRTASEAAAGGAIVIRHPFNLGIGGTVQTGLKFAHQNGYDAVIRLDGDGQHDPAEIPLLFAALQAGRADAVIGSRFLATEMKMSIPFARRLGIATFAAGVTLLTGRRATDTTSGFAAFNRRAIAVLVRYMPQDYPEVESRIILHKAGLTTLELPCCMRPRANGVSSIDSWRSVYYAFKVTVAMLITALKDIPRPPKETSFDDSASATAHRHRLQPSLGGGDRPTDS